MTLFSVALPTFFKSNRTWIGLGLASGEIYGQNLTPYKTYWLDNGYIYTLITSGYIGITIYVALIILFLISYWNLKKQNYLLLPVFLILLDYRSETEDETLEDLNEVKK